MRSTLIFPLLLPFLRFQTTLAAPLPSECTCHSSPLSSRTVDYIFQVTRSRLLTPEECSFICNPSPQPRAQASQQQVIIAVESSATETSTPPSSKSPVGSPAQALTSTLSPATQPATSHRNSPSIFDPAVARPRPLFDAPPAPPKSSHGHRPPAIPASRVSRLTSPAHSQSSLSPAHHKALMPCVFRTAGSLLLLFAVAICLVEAGDAIRGLIRRRVRGRGYSSSGYLRLEEEGGSEKSARWIFQRWRSSAVQE